MGAWTVTSLVPSGKVASTCTSSIMSAMPSMTCSRRVAQAYTRPHLAAVLEQRPRFLERCLRLVPDTDHRGERVGGTEARAGRRLALDAQGVGPGKLAGAAHRPGVEQQTAGEALA